jgi:VanZ family protein
MPQIVRLIHRYRFLLLALWAAALVGVTWGSLAPTMVPPGQHGDKIVHFSAYAYLSALGIVACGGRGRLLVPPAMVLLGGVLEWGQFLLDNGRHADFADALANAVGALTGALLAIGCRQVLRLRALRQGSLS